MAKIKGIVGVGKVRVRVMIFRLKVGHTLAGFSRPHIEEDIGPITGRSQSSTLVEDKSKKALFDVLLGVWLGGKIAE